MAKLRVNKNWVLRVGSFDVEKLFNKDFREVKDPEKAVHASVTQVSQFGAGVSAMITIKDGDVFTYTRTKGQKHG